MSDNTTGEPYSEAEERFGGPVFVPRLYMQRYYFVQQQLIKHHATSVVDFGSAECKIAKFLMRTPSVERLALVDIDEKLLEGCKFIIRPLASDFLFRRERPLAAKIYCGSVTEYDEKLAGFDAVTMVEIIEHLYPDILTSACNMVFGELQPRVIVVTTPNAEFNVLFPGLTGFRHYDHKFEWTRQEFQQWCNRITDQYPYSVEFEGIGDPPDNSQQLGHCSQAAVFLRRTETPVTDSKTSSTYKLIAESVYPHKEASGMSEEEEMLMELQYLMRQHSLTPRFTEQPDTDSVQNVTQCFKTNSYGGSCGLTAEPKSHSESVKCCTPCDDCGRMDKDGGICCTDLLENCSKCNQRSCGIDKLDHEINTDIHDCRNHPNDHTNSKTDILHLKDNPECAMKMNGKVVEQPENINGVCADDCTDIQTGIGEDSGVVVVSDEEDDFITIPLTDLLKYKQIGAKFDTYQLRAFLLEHGYRMTKNQSCVLWPVEYEDRFSDYNDLSDSEGDVCGANDSDPVQTGTSYPCCDSTVNTDIECSEEYWD